MAKDKNLKSWMKNIATEEAYIAEKEFDKEYLQGKYSSILKQVYESEIR